MAMEKEVSRVAWNTPVEKNERLEVAQKLMRRLDDSCERLEKIMQEKHSKRGK
jgi:hypothetical protein